MSEALHESLSNAAVDAFSTLGFLFPVEPPRHGAEIPDGAVVASVTFRGPRCGVVWLAAAPELLPELAENMLGGDEPPGEAEQADALGEIVNVICGNVLPHLGDPRDVYDVAPPTVERGQGLSEQREPSACAALTLDGGEVVVTLTMDRVPAAPAEA